MSLFTFTSSLRASSSNVCWRHRAVRRLANSIGDRAASKVAASHGLPERWRVPGVELPPAEEWTNAFRFTDKRKRRTLSNPVTAQQLAETYVPAGSKGKVIVEAYAGPGMLSRALLKLPRDRISKIILIEDEPLFYEWLKPLQKMDDRVHTINGDAFLWKTYADLEAAGLLDDVEVHDWTAGVHPQLHFISQIPNNVHGEQLVSQLCRAIPDRTWLFRYGRVPLDLIPTTTLWKRLSAAPGDARINCKLSVITQAAANLSITIPAAKLVPPGDHFFSPGKYIRQSKSAAEVAQQPLRIIPREEQMIGPTEIIIWDYILRILFIMRATPLSKCITTLGPGAASLLKTLTDPSLPLNERVDVSKAPNSLTLQEWKQIAKAFEEWPFRPEQLAIHNGFTTPDRNRT